MQRRRTPGDRMFIPGGPLRVEAMFAWEMESTPSIARLVTRITTSLGKGSSRQTGYRCSCTFCWKTARASGTSVSLSPSPPSTRALDSFSGSASSLTWSSIHAHRAMRWCRYDRCRQHAGSCQCAVLWILTSSRPTMPIRALAWNTSKSPPSPSQLNRTARPRRPGPDAAPQAQCRVAAMADEGWRMSDSRCCGFNKEPGTSKTPAVTHGGVFCFQRIP